MESRSRLVRVAGRAVVVLFVPFTFYLSTLDFPSGSHAAQSQNAQSQIETGKRIYSGSCGMTYCHAANGVGGGGPKLRDREFSAEYLTHLITEGIPGTGMPAFKNTLSKQQIEQCVAYIRSLSPKKDAAKATSERQSQSESQTPDT